MNVQDAYNIWADQYDTNNNKTRDLEAVALRETLTNIDFINCLEIGCGTGKNTEWLITKAARITAVDLTEAMLLKAKEKIDNDSVHFLQADINKDWGFANKQFDLAIFSLVLEHIEDLNPIFNKLSDVIISGGYVYIGELHPFKQYSGSKARFDSEQGQQIVTCYNHHISDFTTPAINNGFNIVSINEYFDDNDRTKMPRILSILLTKN